ncbi:MAG: hypothetical protein JWS12_849 [Candidatus Saccharibacteria bacterium]|nr:hypothetical protein [Candidatus Saccharibacteria bacterium]
MSEFQEPPLSEFDEIIHYAYAHERRMEKIGNFLQRFVDIAAAPYTLLAVMRDNKEGSRNHHP